MCASGPNCWAISRIPPASITCLRWAFSEAALLYIRGNKEAERYYNRLINRHGKGKALTIIAKRLGVAVYYMLKRRQQPLDILDTRLLWHAGTIGVPGPCSEMLRNWNGPQGP